MGRLINQIFLEMKPRGSVPTSSAFRHGTEHQGAVPSLYLKFDMIHNIMLLFVHGCEIWSLTIGG
jgi:hypothetical protein